MNTAALNTAREEIKNKFGSLSDLDEELQNTIVNIYYKKALIGQNVNQAILGNGIKRMSKSLDDAAFYIEASKALPEIINIFREDVLKKRIAANIRLMTDVFLFTYKYRMELGSKPYFVAKFLKFFHMHNVDEIPNLHRQT